MIEHLVILNAKFLDLLYDYITYIPTPILIGLFFVFIVINLVFTYFVLKIIFYVLKITFQVLNIAHYILKIFSIFFVLNYILLFFVWKISCSAEEKFNKTVSDLTVDCIYSEIIIEGLAFPILRDQLISAITVRALVLLDLVIFYYFLKFIFIFFLFMCDDVRSFLHRKFFPQDLYWTNYNFYTFTVCFMLVIFFISRILFLFYLIQINFRWVGLNFSFILLVILIAFYREWKWKKFPYKNNKL